MKAQLRSTQIRPKTCIHFLKGLRLFIFHERMRGLDSDRFMYVLDRNATG